MAFSGLRGDLSNTLRTLNGSQGQMSLQLVAEMHISPINGDSVWGKKKKKRRGPLELPSIHQTALSSLMCDYQPPPHTPANTLLPSRCHWAASNLGHFNSGWKTPQDLCLWLWRVARSLLCVCVWSCRMILCIFFSLRSERSLVLGISWL